MEGIDQCDIDTNTNNLKTIMDSNCKNLTKDQILEHIQNVINGSCNSLNLYNTFSIWKNTVIGLSTIKHINNDFHKGVNLWVNITMDSIICCHNEIVLKSMVDDFPWINDLLVVKKYINTYYDN
tara:strand:- start:1276 stop:1647 length:372 start_codon:yes stop_codon:yes gene_type:complete